MVHSLGRERLCQDGKEPRQQLRHCCTYPLSLSLSALTLLMSRHDLFVGFGCDVDPLPRARIRLKPTTPSSKAAASCLLLLCFVLLPLNVMVSRCGQLFLQYSTGTRLPCCLKPSSCHCLALPPNLRHHHPATFSPGLEGDICSTTHA